MNKKMPLNSDAFPALRVDQSKVARRIERNRVIVSRRRNKCAICRAIRDNSRDWHLLWQIDSSVGSTLFQVTTATYLSGSKMGAALLPLLLFTAIWGIVGIVLPIFVPKGTNRGILQVMLILAAFTCWLFWLCCYIAQMNPLIGPKLPKNTILMMAREWSNVQFDTTME